MGSSAQLNRRLIDATGRLAIGGSLLPAVAFLATAVLLEAGVSSIMLLFLLFLAAAATRLYFVRRPRPVYLVEYACFCAAPAYRAPSATFLEHTRLMMLVPLTKMALPPLSSPSPRARWSGRAL